MIPLALWEESPDVRPIHPKAMPVILHPENYANWLNGDNAESLAVPFPSQLMALETADS
jgi:putative SOS response-associated peptidase YedK